MEKINTSVCIITHIGKYVPVDNTKKRQVTKYVFYRKVSGYMDDEDWLEESQTLDSIIGGKSFQVKSDEFYANGYNSPMQFWNRRNEVWKVKV